MASYVEWNKAIANYFAHGLTPGDTYYLSVDEDALAEIGSYYLNEPGLTDSVRDFEIAVIKACVREGHVQLPETRPRSFGDPPPCVALLGAMVLAAYRMAPEDDIAEINYFTRLREVLGMTGARGRPPGLNPPGAPEERLWIALNGWILHRGWQPSAERGPEGPMKFTNYPLSQSLLRIGDKEKLERDFSNARGDLGQDSDRERVSSWFFSRATNFSTHHIRKLAHEAGMDRYEAIANAVYDVYATIDWTRRTRAETTPKVRLTSARWTAGLYRESDPLFDVLEYYLLPRRQYKETRSQLSVLRNGSSQLLHRQHDGQYRPLWPVSPDGGESYQIVGDPRIRELYLPARNFWVLTRDRRDDESGEFASRGAPRLGETFLLLCQESCHDQLNTLSDEGLLEWEEDPVEVHDHRGWMEFRECMVLSANWDGIIPQIPELFDELRPRSRASISLQGGLKTGRRDAWLEGYTPNLFVTSFDRMCRAIIMDVSRPNVEPSLDDTVETNTLIELPQLLSGDYLIQAISSDGRTVDRRYIKVVAWEELQPGAASTAFGTPIGDQLLQGALVRPGPTGKADVGL